MYIFYIFILASSSCWDWRHCL